MLKQLLIAMILAFLAITAYQIYYGGNVIPITPIGPPDNALFKFLNNGGYAMLNNSFIGGPNYVISFKIKTTTGSGLIMTMGGPVVMKPVTPYIVIFIQYDVLRFIHSGPSGAAVLLTDPHAITDGAWHIVTIHRNNTSWSMSVDGKQTAKMSARSDDIVIPTLSYFGNRPVKTELPNVDGMVGCLTDIVFNDSHKLDFTITGGQVLKTCSP